MDQGNGRRAAPYRFTNTIRQAFVETLPDLQLRVRRDGSIVAMELPPTLELPDTCVWGGHLREHLGTADAERWCALVARCLDSREVQTDTQTVSLFGRPMLFEVRLNVASDDEVLALARDISARQEALRRLEANHRLLSTIAQNFPGCLYVIEVASGRPIYANRPILDLLGYDTRGGELTPQELSEVLFTGPERARVIERIATLLGLGDEETQEDDVDVADALGRSRTLRVRSRVFSRGPDGRPQDVFCVVEDFTDRKIATERLRHGQKLELLGQLAGVVVHDFNNIITSVRGFAELLLDDLPDDSASREDARIIVAAMDRAAGVARRLLAFSRNEATRPRVVDVAEALQRMTPLLRGVVGERCQVEVVPEAGVGSVLIDPVDLEQCVVNLVVNARDAMPLGGAVRVSLRHGQLRGLRAVCIAVTDGGTGIDPAVRDRLFEPFFTTKAMGQGTGLGLASVERVISAAQGVVDVQSELGRGSTFTLVLPLHEGTEAVAESTDVEAPRMVRRARVLVVEDDALVRRLVVDTLGRDGHEVRSASDAAGASALARDEHFDLVVSDVVMPGTSGPMLVAALREAHPTLRVIFMSGYYENPDLDPRAVQGARMLPKPFSPDELLRAVQGALVD